MPSCVAVDVRSLLLLTLLHFDVAFALWRDLNTCRCREKKSDGASHHGACSLLVGKSLPQDSRGTTFANLHSAPSSHQHGLLLQISHCTPDSSKVCKQRRPLDGIITVLHSLQEVALKVFTPDSASSSIYPYSRPEAVVCTWDQHHTVTKQFLASVARRGSNCGVPKLHGAIPLLVSGSARSSRMFLVIGLSWTCVCL